MSQQRPVYAKREILANDVNNISQSNIYNNKILTKDLLGITDGVASGLNLTYIGLILTITAGNYYKTDNFYELLNDTNITLTSDGTYKIYMEFSQTQDMPISGYILLDTLTRIEQFDVINSRIYDSINVGSTTGALPSGAIQIYDVTVTGGTITSVNDLRTLITFGNLNSYSIQEFSLTGKNLAHRANKITGYIYDERNSSQHKFITSDISSSYAGISFLSNNGSNSSSIGFLANANNNIGYKASLTGSAIGFLSNVVSTAKGFLATSSSLVNTTAFEADGFNKALNIINSNIGVNINTISTGTGINIVGQNSNINEYGIKLTNLSNALDISLNGVDNGQSLLKISATGSLANNGYNIESNIYNSGTGLKIDWVNAGISDLFTGINIINSSTNGTNGTGIKVNGNSSYPFAISYLFDESVLGLLGLNCTTGSQIILDSTISSPITNVSDKIGHIIELGQEGNLKAGIYINKSVSGTPSSNFGILINHPSEASPNKLNTGILINGVVDSGITVTRFDNGAFNVLGNNSTSSNHIAFNSYNTACGLKIVKTSNITTSPSISIVNQASSSNDGIHITNASTGIDMNNSSYGIILRNSGTGLDIRTTGAYGVKIDNSQFGLNITNCDTPINIDNTGDRHLRLEPFASNPTSAVAGDIAVVTQGANTILRIFSNGNWVDCN